MNEIFCSGQDFPFGGKSVSVCRDLYQILPVRVEPVFTFNETETMEGLISSDLWQKFRLAEFDQVMRQDDEILINLLYKIRVGQIDQNTEHVIKSRFIDKMIQVIAVIFWILLQIMPQLKDTMTTD